MQQLPAEKVAAIRQAAREIPDRDLPKRNQEFTPFRQGVPHRFLSFLVEFFWGLPMEDVHQLEDIVEQVSLPEAIVGAAEDQVKARGLQGQELPFREFLYDPSANSTSVLQLWHMCRFRKFHMERMLELSQFGAKLVLFSISLVFVGVLWGIVVEQFMPQFFLKVQFPTWQEILWQFAAVLMVGSAWKALEIGQEIVDLMKFMSADLGRVRCSLTTGNVIQLLMRQVQKLEFLEKRSMMKMGFSHDFWRHMQQEVCEVHWQSHPAGKRALEAHILQYLAIKFEQFGDDALTGEQVEQFKEEIKKFFLSAIHDLGEQDDREEFLNDCMTEEIDAIFARHGEFADRVATIWSS